MSSNAMPNDTGPVVNGGAPSNAALDRRVTVLETRFDTILPMLATKQDLAELRVDFQKLRADLFETLNGQFKWIIALFATVFIGMLGANYAMWNSMERLLETHLRQATIPQSPPPTTAANAPVEAPKSPPRR